MQARMKLAMMQLSDPRFVRVALFGLSLVIAFVAQANLGTQVVLADPASGGGGPAGG